MSTDDTPDDQSHPSRSAKVAAGHPSDKRPWDKGGPSPNPRGRPKKKHLQGLFAQLDPMAAMLVEHDLRVIGEIDGEEITNGEALIRGLSRRALKETAAARLYTKLMTAAHQARREHHLSMLAAAVQHKKLYGPIFAKQERLGKRVPDVWPHPEDLIIGPDGTVKIVGPIDYAEQEALDQLLKHRDQLIEGGAILADPKQRSDTDMAHKLWAQLRRRFYRINPAIPTRLRKPFPRFVR